MLSTPFLHDPATQALVADLYMRHAEVICDDALEQWPDFYAEQCVYRVISRVNHDRGLPLSIIYAESRGALVDRVTAIRNTMVYAPRVVHHGISGMRVLSQDEGVARTRSHFVVHQTLGDGVTQVQMVGRSFDTIDLAGTRPVFRERLAVFDTELVPGSVVYPI